MAGQQYKFSIDASGEARDAEGRLLDSDGNPKEDDAPAEGPKIEDES